MGSSSQSQSCNSEACPSGTNIMKLFSEWDKFYGNFVVLNKYYEDGKNRDKTKETL